MRRILFAILLVSSALSSADAALPFSTVFKGRGKFDHLVSEAREFLSGKSMAVKEMLAEEMEKSSNALDFERAAALRDRLEALSTIQSHQGVHPRVRHRAARSRLP